MIDLECRSAKGNNVLESLYSVNMGYQGLNFVGQNRSMQVFVLVTANGGRFFWAGM